MLPYTETELARSDQEVLPTVISTGVDISEVPGCYLLQQMSSQSGLQKLIQRLVSHELTAYLSVFNECELNELWPYKSM